MVDNINDKVCKNGNEEAKSEGLNFLDLKDCGFEKKERTADDIRRDMEALAPKIEEAARRLAECMTKVSSCMGAIPAEYHQSMADWVAYHNESQQKV